MKLFHKKITFSLRAKLMLLIETFVIVLVITIGIITTLQTKETLVNELHKRGIALASDLSIFSARPLISKDLADLRRIVNSFMTKDYVNQVIVLDNNNNVVMHNDLSELGKTYEIPINEKGFCSNGNFEKYKHLYSKGEACNIIMPINVEELKLGSIILGYSHVAVAKEIKNAERLIFFIALATTIIGAFVAYLVATFISSPIKEITDATKKLAGGDLDFTLSVKRNDEIGILASSFNIMAGDLRKHRTHLEHLVEERTADLGSAIKRLENEIGERRHVEEALRESEKKYRDLVENSMAGVYKTNFKGDIKYINEAMADIFEFDNIDDMIREGTIPRYKDLNDRESLIKNLKKSGKVKNFEFDVITGKGNIKNVILSSVTDGDELSGMIVDITERKNAEKAMIASELKYRNLFEDSLDAIYITSREGNFLDINQSGLNLFGYTKNEIIGLDATEIYLNPAERKIFQTEIERHGSVKNYGINFKKKDGEVMDCLVTSTVRKTYNGEIMGYQGIIRDITAQKLLEAQLQHAQKMEAIGTLGGGIAHDFNNLLQGIIGYVELMLFKKNLEDPDYKYLKQINKAALRASELTKGLLVFSRKLESKLLPIDLNHEVKQVYELLYRTIPKMIDIKLYLSEDLKTINADSMQLEQLMMNMGVNAKDAMPYGGELVFETKNVNLDEEYCKTHLDVTAGEYVLLSVADTGHGIDKSSIDHIFEPFYTTKGIGKGTGLGLAMVYGIVKNHGGHIACYSEPGKGTVFKIYFPALVYEDFEQKTDGIDDTEFRGGNETILLVDDEEIVRNHGKDMLAKFGYNVITAEDGEKAIELYKAKKDNIDLIILDVGMPGMGGQKCLDELLRINPEVKVIICSGYDISGKLKKSLESDISGLIGKPYSLKDMIKKVRKVLDKG
jgi:two-component system cell cycle sensor histidine kinase/response regulator CckA